MGGIDRRRWSAAGAAAVYNLRLPPKASGKDTGAGPAPGFMRLTPDSRAPAKADPSARAGVGVVVVVGVGVVVLLLFSICCVNPCCHCRPCCLLLLLADVGPIWAQVCPCLGPRLAHVAHILA